MFIQTEPTPNPDTVKFVPGETVAGCLLYTSDAADE